MKRLLAFLALVTVAHGAGTVQQSIQQLGQTNNWVLAFQWTGDSITGAVPNTAGTGLNCCTGYLVVQVETVPLTPAPTAGYSVAIQDSSGVDILAGAAASLSNVNPQSFAASTSAPPVQGTLTLVLSGQSVASARGTVYVFLSKPGSINVATIGRGAIASSANWLTIANPPIVDQRVFNYTAQNPGTTLSSGACSFAMNPLPAGLVTGGSVYIQGGVGTAEALANVTVSGSTVSGTCANNHSGNWNVSSATGGIGEAVVQAEANLGGIVQIYKTATIYAPIVVPTASFIAITIQAFGRTTGPYLIRGASFTAGDIISYNQTSGGVSLTIRDLTIYNGGPFGSFINNTSGGAIHLVHAVAPPATIQNVLISDGFTGIDLDGVAQAHVTGVQIQWNDSYLSGFTALTAIRIHNTGAGPVNTDTFSDITVLGSAQGTVAVNPASSCVQIEFADGLQINNMYCGGTLHGIWVLASTNSRIDVIQITNCVLDVFQSHAIYFSGSGTPITTGPFEVYSSWISTEYIVNTAYNGAGIFVDTGAQLNKLVVNGTQILQSGQGGIVMNGSTTLIGELDVTGSNIRDNNMSNGGTAAAIEFLGNSLTWSGVHISSNHIYNSLSSSHMTLGVYFPGTSDTITNLDITGNNFCPVGSGTSFGAGQEILSGAGSVYTKATIGHNSCVDSNTATTVASAATLAFPIYPNFLISGNTGVTAITTTALAPGETGTLITTGGAVAFTAGASIGNSCTTTQNKPYVWLFDGTKVWINGSGC